MSFTRSTGRLGARLGAVVVGLLLTGLALPAFAAEGSIDHFETKDGKLEVLYSLPDVGDATPDLSSLAVTLDGKSVDANATLASDAKVQVRRTAILAIGVDDSMAANGKFTEAKSAAQVFLDSAPDDLYVGVVTFAGSVTVAQEPTLDRSATASVIKGLKLSRGTFLYPGLIKAVDTAGTDGQRSVIVLSDGRDTSDTQLDEVTSAIKAAEVKVDVVALAQSSGDERLLEPLSSAGDGAVISASDPKALGQVFANEAQTLAKQIQISATVPPDASHEGTLTVSVDAGDQSYSDAAFVTVSVPQVAKPVGPSTDLRAAPQGLHLTKNVLFAG